MATYTITNEATREVLVRSLWMSALLSLPEPDNLTVWLDNSDQEFEASRLELAECVDKYGDRILELDRVRSAQLGEAVQIATPLDRMLRNMRDGIAENPDDLLNAEPAERERMLRCFDAVTALLSVEAVA